jgi:hypothetical protein
MQSALNTISGDDAAVKKNGEVPKKDGIGGILATPAKGLKNFLQKQTLMTVERTTALTKAENLDFLSKEVPDTYEEQ